MLKVLKESEDTDRRVVVDFYAEYVYFPCGFHTPNQASRVAAGVGRARHCHPLLSG